MNLFIQYAVSNPFFFFSWVLIVVFSICIHEYAHALTAWKLGDDTAARAGHLSLNPLVQMGPTSLLFLALIGIAWGAVPVSLSRFRAPWAGAAVAFAGPASNLALSFLFALISVLIRAFGWEAGEATHLFLRLGSIANGVLFVLNMLPVPMLDGWAIYSYFVPRMRELNPAHAQTLSLVLIAAIFLTPLGDLVWAGGGFFHRGFTGLLSILL